jgi:hypothetical protein
MEDPRWPLLKQCLIERGWTAQDDTLYAPHDTLWFTMDTEQPNFAAFRDRMSLSVEGTAAYVDRSVDQAHVHEDLVSLVAALDEVLQN